ncbi:MAG: hypothetical protein IPK93_05985 [Solirubrobacterales bacterium]|nr:hypothetical protein [Solirubrobacterales bacterium]
MHTYYIFFDLLAALLIGAAVWTLTRAVRRPLTPAGSAVRAALRVARSVLALAAGLLLLFFPVLTGTGWRVILLSVPDFALVLLVLGLLLLANGAYGLGRQAQIRRVSRTRAA